MKITCHMIMSVDGRLISKYWSPLYNASSSVTEVYEAADANYPQTAGSSDAKPWPSTALMS